MNAVRPLHSASGPSSSVVYDQRGISVTLLDHGVQAAVTLGEELDYDITEQELFEILKTAGVTVGVQPEGLRELAARRPRQQAVVVAAGTPPVPGQDGWIEYLLSPPDGERPAGELREDGSVDFKNLGLVVNVDEGTLLATRHPPTAGEPGRSVTGEELPAPPGKDVKLSGGKNTRLSEDGSQLLAARAGCLLRSNGKLWVTDLHTVKGDVDFSTGNIDVRGSVFISGNVLSGFEVRAEHDITVGGVVEAARLEAGGDITLQHGVQGGGKAELVAQGTIRAAFIQHAKVRARGPILVAGPLLHCISRSGDSIRVSGKNGAVCGGVARALSCVQATILGADAYTKTRVEVGRDPDLEERLVAIQDLQRTLAPKLSQLHTAVENLKALKAGKGQLAPQQTRMLNEATRMRFALARRRKELQAEQEAIEQELATLREASIECSGAAYPGVCVVILGRRLKINEPISAVRFQCDKDGVAMLPAG